MCSRYLISWSHSLAALVDDVLVSAALQAAWDPGEVDASASRHDEAVWLALRNTGIARKACLHAHAMLCALEGGELVIPAPPGVSPTPEHLYQKLWQLRETQHTHAFLTVCTHPWSLSQLQQG